MLKTVTITGADDSVNIEDLADLKKKFPFVEWGILFSKNTIGEPRFPSRQWLHQLSERTDLELSLHLCGSYVREFFKHGSTAFLSELGYTWNSFNRVQLNTHAQFHEHGTDSIRYVAAFMEASSSKKFIFQIDGQNDFISKLSGYNLKNISGLFDLSHGAGLLPKSWPTPIDGIECGYAGGLSPENLRSQIQRIIHAVPSDYEFWIDMETHVRSNMDTQFDLKKVEQCLQISQPFVFQTELSA